jgi:hypothetical protein
METSQAVFAGPGGTPMVDEPHHKSVIDGVWKPVVDQRRPGVTLLILCRRPIMSILTILRKDGKQATLW